jgi:hypothetical protein
VARVHQVTPARRRVLRNAGRNNRLTWCVEYEGGRRSLFLRNPSSGALLPSQAVDSGNVALRPSRLRPTVPVTAGRGFYSIDHSHEFQYADVAGDALNPFKLTVWTSARRSDHMMIVGTCVASSVWMIA